MWEIFEWLAWFAIGVALFYVIGAWLFAADTRHIDSARREHRCHRDMSKSPWI